MVRNLRWPLVSSVTTCAYYPKVTKRGTVKQVTTTSLEQLCCTWQSLWQVWDETPKFQQKKRCFSHFASQLWDERDELSKPIQHAIAHQDISTQQWMSALQPVLQSELDMSPNFKQVVAASNPLHSLQLAGQERHQGAWTRELNLSFRQTKLILLRVLKLWGRRKISPIEGRPLGWLVKNFLDLRDGENEK